MLGIVDGLLVELGVSDSKYTITALDGSDDTTKPLSIVEYTGDADTLNIERQLIGGDLAVTLRGDAAGTGRMTLWYRSDSAAGEGRALLARPTIFQLAVPTRPAFDMQFVRYGAMSRVQHNVDKDVWVLTVGYREVTL